MQGDLVQRLRDRAYSGLPDRLSEEAADEIKRLRLTDAERDAIDWASLVLRNMAEERDQVGDYCRRLNEAAALMLNLLQRLK
jgi:hypothetical protein